jgi:hypothetical protein
MGVFPIQEKMGKMSRMYLMMMGMGFMFVLIAFVMSYVNSQTAAIYFAEG